MTDQDEAMILFDTILGDMGSYAEYGRPNYREDALRVIRAALDKARDDALEEAANCAYVKCASTRHVKMGIAVSDAIRALKGGKHGAD